MIAGSIGATVNFLNQYKTYKFIKQKINSYPIISIITTIFTLFPLNSTSRISVFNRTFKNIST